MSWTRRLFVRESLKGWLGLVVAPAIFAAARTFVGSSEPNQAQPMDLGDANALEPGMSKTVRFGDERVLIARARSGQVHAISATCTHMGCSLRFEPDVADSDLACNCHESRFSLSGENMSGPATRPLKEYRLAVVGGRLSLSDSDESSQDSH